MAGDWIKFEGNTPEKREVLAITVELGFDDPDLTVGKLLKVWRWFDQHTVNGNAQSVTTALLDRLIGVSGITQAMANVGWMIIDENGLTIPNFERHNGRTAKDRALTAKRVANHKSNVKGNADTVTLELPREEKRREEYIYTDLPTKTESLKTKPQTKPKPKKQKTAIPENFGISENVKAWAEKNNFQNLEKHLASFIDKCKANGYTYVDWDSAFRNAISDNWAKLPPPDKKTETKYRETPTGREWLHPQMGWVAEQVQA